MTSRRIAAVQMCAELGQVDANLKRAEALVRAAFADGAQWVILPEFFTTAMAFHPSLREGARPLGGAPKELLRRLAVEQGGVVGGSFLAHRAGDAFNIFVLAFPDNSIRIHAKDIPTMWENCYYIGGADDGVLETARENIGAALCWEFIRTQTAQRLIDKIDIVVGGSCWWDFPDDSPDSMDAVRALNRTMAREAPAQLARILGVPVAHAAHAGTFEGFMPPDEKTPYTSAYLGETQIIDGRGTVLERMGQDDGEGFILAEVTPGRVDGEREPIPERFWIPDMPAPLQMAWEMQNKQGREYYERVTQPQMRNEHKP